MKIKSITIELKNQDIVLSVQEAKALYRELYELFKDGNTVRIYEPVYPQIWPGSVTTSTDAKITIKNHKPDFHQ